MAKVGPQAKLARTGVIPPGTNWLMDGTWTISPNQEYVLLAQQEDGNLVLYRVIGVPPKNDGDDFNGEALWATNTADEGSHNVIFQHDGNYVVYDKDGNSLWASDTAGITPLALILQDDGNLVIYKEAPAWATHTQT